VVALGLFDGVHRGHQEILRQTLALAETHRLHSAVFTFQNHPRSVLSNGSLSAPRLLIPFTRRAELLQVMGIDRVVSTHFSREWANILPEIFAVHFLKERLQASQVVVGFNYCFGRNAGGRVVDLERYGEQYGFQVRVIPAVMVADEEVSSTRIRTALQAGQLELVRHLLGRPAEIFGRVTLGDQRGRQLGFPTANLEPEIPPLLPSGVYAVRVLQVIESETKSLGDGMFFIGPRRTFYGDEAECVLEVHILDYEGDLYGANLRLEIIGKVRNPQKFTSAEELVRQIEQDKLACLKILSEA
jgi:riboflavin kinase/FMN adenylyltransferase